jgi:glutamate--cysteine ligase
MLTLADAGLKARSEEDWAGQDERQFLTALRVISESGVTPAEEKLALFQGRWRGSVDPIFAEFAY